MSDKRPQEPVLIEPTPKRTDFFNWLEQLFDGPTEMPEKIEVCSVKGRSCEIVVKLIHTYTFLPEGKEPEKKETGEEAGKEHGKKNGKPDRRRGGKPSREDLVHMSNAILDKTQTETDAVGREQRFGCHAIHFTRDSQPYSRFLIRCSPQTVKDPEDEDEETGAGGLVKRYSEQFLGHHERQFNLGNELILGLVDRQNRELERMSRELGDQRMATRVAQEQNEKLQSLAIDREMAREWNKLKVDAARDGMNLFMGLAPPIINQLAGKKVIKTDETPESFTLKAFFKTDKEGGRLTQAQANAAFGIYDDTPDNNLTKPGVLRHEQVRTLIDVATCVVSADKLDDLIPPDGAIAISVEQMLALQNIFTHEQLAPLFVLFQSRQHKNGNGN
jgi:hypothetical protein